MYLATHSYFSLRYGTLSVEKLVELAKNNNVKALALTDINNSTGILNFVKCCFQNNIKPIAGIEFRKNDKFLYTLIAKNNEGFHEINEFLSHHNLNEIEFPNMANEFSNVYTIYPFGKKEFNKLNSNEFIGVRTNQVRKIFSTKFHHDQSKIVIFHPVTFSNHSDYILHQHLRAIDKNSLLGKLSETDFAQTNEFMVSPAELYRYFNFYPQIIHNTEKLLDSCYFEFDYQTIKNKLTYTGDKYQDKLLLEKLTFEGFKHRYKENNTVAKTRILKELQTIDNLGFSAYYLITWDIIRYSMSEDLYHVGRGSGANSIVAYCLQITDVDPIELNLYFERFLNPKRTSPPDFDIDYSWRDRDKVHDYIFSKYGKRHACLMGAMSTFSGRSILRELGKVYGLPKEEVDIMIEKPDSELMSNHITNKMLTIGKMMEDFPNIRSIHAGGVIISEKPLTYYTALDLPPKGYPTSQWDMYTAEEIGFEKLDVLSQRGLGHIRESVEIIAKTKQIQIDIHQIEKFKTDENVVKLLSESKALGCFYIESPAMRGLLKKLRCNNYLSLVAASSIIRPGVAKSGMMKEFIKRFHEPESFQYLHPIFKEQLGETFGVMVYQEDVLKICHHFAGLDLAEADVLRRLMSGKPRFKNELQQIVSKFFANCKERGYSDELTQEVWRQIQSFAGYSFSKAHSASYAVESFQSLFLKTYFPLEFMVAVINNEGGFYQTWVYFHEAKCLGAIIQPPCINHSEYYTSIHDKSIYVGFRLIANFEYNVAKIIISNRRSDGNYTSLENFVRRVPCGLEQLILLIRIGAFRFTQQTKANLLWEAHRLKKNVKEIVKPGLLFDVDSKKIELPDLSQSLLSDAYDEIELISFPITLNYFEMLETNFRGEVSADQMIDNVGKTVRMLGALVTIKYVRTIKHETMHFGTFIDVNGRFFDTIHFPQSLINYRFQGLGVYLIKGKISQEFGHPSLEVEKMAKMPFKKDERFK